MEDHSGVTFCGSVTCGRDLEHLPRIDKPQGSLRPVSRLTADQRIEIARHPLVNVLEGSQIMRPIRNCRKNFGLYVIFLKDVRCADQLHLSANYFGDLIKKETGKSAQEYVQWKIMDTAKDMLVLQEKSISEISYALGYQYPQYFSRAFKRAVGCTPNEFRSRN